MEDERQRARATGRYRRALKRGVLKPATACEMCREVCRTNGHHWHGYADGHALDVQWLCQPCHNRVHTARLAGLASGSKFVARVPLEERREMGRRGGRATTDSRTPEQRSELGRKGGTAFVAKSTPGERAARGRKGGTTAAARMTPEQLSERGRRAVQARWAKRSTPAAEIWTPTEDEWKVARAAALARLGCTWDELVAMHLSGNYETPEHFKALFTFDDAFRCAL